MERRFEFSGTGGELFGKLIVGALLCGITFGIYTPWFICSFYRYIYSRSHFNNRSVQFEFGGQGGQLFVTCLVGGLLTMITFGIYGPWFMVKLIKFICDNSVGKAADGNLYRIRFNGAGGELFVVFLVGYLLTMITLGIYGPWFMCKMQKYYAEKAEILRGDQSIGSFAFNGTGGDLFVTFLVGTLLTMITFGIYAAWYQVKLLKFFTTNTQVTFAGRPYVFDFSGEGGQLFVIMLVGNLLSMVTLGIYTFWFMAKMMKYMNENTLVRDSGAPQMQPQYAAAPGYGG